jgi:hypothetical protein
MGRRRRERIARGRAKPQVRWDAADWQRGWSMAIRRIEGVPPVVAGLEPFDHALDMLDRGFAEGDWVQFGHGLITLMDCCAEAVNRGDCQQWWD